MWVRMKLLVADLEVWLGIFDLAPGCNQVEYSYELQAFLRKMPKD